MVSYAIRPSYHQSHGYLPAQLIFGRDMFSAVLVDIDWDAIRIDKQIKIIQEKTQKESLTHTLEAIISL